MTAPIITKAEWLERRGKRLSASNFARAAFTPFSLWSEMTGRFTPTFDDEAQHVAEGRIVEQAVLKLHARRAGIWTHWGFTPEAREAMEGALAERGSRVEAWVEDDVEGEVRFQPLVVSACGRFSATLDGMAFDPARGTWGCLEAKKRDWSQLFAEDVDDDEIEPHTWFQVGAQLFISGLDWCDLVPLVARKKLQPRRFTRESFPMDKLLAVGERFLGWLERDEAPPATGDDLDALKAAYPVREGVEVTLGEDVAALVIERDALRKEAKKLEEEADERQAKILQAVGEAKTAKLPNGWTIRRSVVNVPAQQRTAYSYTNCTVSKKR